ncbi:phage tail tube protein [Clostridium saccharobutylicum]|uniref:Uncharacterized protein n=1 Tax=Clostridium saccharobutylicum DSM 13864 TaxID=1345695 RepID=U5MTW1_CLOSA|nr:phage tail tube protein [Clostridium saccharobutylicum]AGX43953.1 hypothetical protein CLSA_c29860 [Clostridium saccharobutylicum DSM 13864]AQR91250.1 hypothetical protein CLOSC_29740 [Clostridium saccharobutylicum]AQS01154.1 hypothetical protein CSACC_29810 [Clostridium saccharobutylicum]AQS10567.1 hypothetical protein CLOBY_27120 [Clostridium saccharobutylicum]AQS15137.1 hypothetical protein CLOSACC_29810 [Clostridium saccharobutylicum]
MSKKIKNVCNGQFGHLYLNGVEVFMVQSFNAELKLDLEELPCNGGWETGFKLKKVSLEGKFKVSYVDSMGLRDCVNMMKKGITPTFKITSSLQDPEQYKGQIEQIYIGEAFLENLIVADWEIGKMVEKEFSYKANPMSLNVLKEILDSEGVKVA